MSYLNGKIAVVGASSDESKYGYRVFKDLLGKNLDVVPVNPKLDELLEVKAFSELGSINPKPTLVVTVVPPEVTESITDKVIELGIDHVWMQPGSESQKAIDKLIENNVEVTFNSCIMIATK